MKPRRWLPPALCLLAGAALNVAVAWTSAWLFFALDPMGGGTVHGPQAAAHPWPLGAPAGWPAPDAYERVRLPGSDGTQANAADGTNFYHAAVLRAGLPMRSLRSTILIGPGVVGGAPAVFRPWRLISWRIGFAVTAAGNEAALPLDPLPVGFAVNTVCWGAGLWAAAALLGRRRRANRRKRGLCPACRYDLGHDLASGCPECGWGRTT